MVLSAITAGVTGAERFYNRGDQTYWYNYVCIGGRYDGLVIR